MFIHIFILLHWNLASEFKKLKINKKINLNHKEIIAPILEKLPGMAVNFNSGPGLKTSHTAPQQQYCKNYNIICPRKL